VTGGGRVDNKKYGAQEQGVYTPNETRISVLRLGFTLIFIVFAIRLFSMQILSGDTYKTRAESIMRRTTVIPAQRGEIFDREYKTALVYNTDTFAVSVSPAEVPQNKWEELFQNLSRILKMSAESLERKIPNQYRYSYQSVEIAGNVQYETIAALAERRDRLPGVSWQSKPIRSYSNTGSISHVIGYLGDITRDELTMLYNRGYVSGDMIGKTGIEREYDELLRGKEGFETRVVDVRGREVLKSGGVTNENPQMGKNLVLTIDSKIQLLAEKALGQRLGAAVVLRPATGEILAMVSYPWFDPDIFNRNDASAQFQALLNDPRNPLINRAIQSSYPPGSTFKVVMSAGILDSQVFPPEQTINCEGEMDFGGRTWKCHVHKPGHGRLNLRRALAQSCDIYFWVTGRDSMGVERIVEYAHEFGFGETTGIDLPGELAGVIPTPQWKERRYHERWQGGDTMNMSIGQGFTLVTPLQMANMTAMAVNDGVIYKPHILKEVRDPVTGAVENSVRPEVLRKSDIPHEVFQTVRENMRSVVSEGTAQYPMNIRSVQIAGKTGTSEIGLADRWHAWFAAFAPYETDNPEERVVVSVIVEAANPWEWWAVYASALIFQGIFADQTYEEAAAALGFQYLMPAQARRE